MADEGKILQSSITLLREENRADNEKVIKNTQQTSEGVDGLKNTMKDLLDEFRGQAGDKEEARKKSGKSKGRGSVASIFPDFNKTGGGILDILIGLPAALLGFATGLAKGWAKAIKDVGKLIAKVVSSTLKTILGGVKSILKIFSKPFIPIADDIAKATKGFRADIARRVKSVLTSVRNIINVFKMDLTPLVDMFKKIPSAIKSAGQSAKNLLNVFKLDFKPLVNGFTNISNAVKAGTNGVAGLSRSVSGAFRPLNKLEKIFRSFGKSVTTVSAFITTSFAKISTIFKNVGVSFKSVGSFTTGISETFSKLIQPMKNTVNYLKTVAPGIFKAFSALGRLFGWPLTIAIGLYEGIKASLDSFRAGDILGGVMQFLTGAINGAILSLVDLLKGGISWIAAKLFGEDNPVTTFLNSFDFTELFSTFMENITTFIRAIPEKVTAFVDDIKEWWNGLMETEDPIGYLMEPINKLIQNIKDFVLGFIPSMDDIKSIASGALDSAKEFLGIKTEEDKEKEAAVYRERNATAEQQKSYTEDKPTREEWKAMSAADKTEYRLNKIKQQKEGGGDQQRVEAAPEKVETQQKVESAPDNDYTQPPTKKRSEMTPWERAQYRNSRLERTQNTQRQMNGQQAQEQSKENAQAKAKATAVQVINAPQQNQTVNNSSSTAAVMDNNLPTVDNNDRSWALGF